MKILSFLPLLLWNLLSIFLLPPSLLQSPNERRLIGKINNSTGKGGMC